MTTPPTPPGKLGWRRAKVRENKDETGSAHTVFLDDEHWQAHEAGQHIDVRLTAPDGYQASRSYSLSSGPGEGPAITVERVDDGEVSPYLVDALEPSDEIEIRGPIGGYFVWRPDMGPTLLIGGGSGIAPLRAIWQARTDAAPMGVIYSSQTAQRVIFAEELTQARDMYVRVHLTREEHADYRHGRVGVSDLSEAIEAVKPQLIYVCGPTAFVESVSQNLVGMGIDPRALRTERFG
ncbi:oxidoreductase [Ornithinimicrobium sp. Arc0846-15]|nr:oxidoreductase [Ornithinimicrobium laminariae]